MMKKVIGLTKSIIGDIKKIIKIIKIKETQKRLESSNVIEKYTVSPIFPNKEIMEDAMKRI